MFSRFLPQSTRPNFSAECTETSVLSALIGRTPTTRFSPHVSMDILVESWMRPAGGIGHGHRHARGASAVAGCPKDTVIGTGKHACFCLGRRHGNIIHKQKCGGSSDK